MTVSAAKIASSYKDLPFLAKLQLLETLRARNSAEAGGSSTFAKYRMDPCGFGRERLGESYTPDVERMMESVRDNPVTVARSANATGKTHGAARVAAWFYKCFDPCQVYTAAAPPEDNLKRLLWGEIGSIVEDHKGLFSNDIKTSLFIGRAAKVFLRGVAIPTSGSPAERQAKFSGKHSPHLLFILDEGDAIPDEVYAGIESCMSGGFARMLIMFNPRHKSGPVFRMERDKQAAVVTLSAFNHPNVIEGRDIIPGAVTREKTVERINEWTRPMDETEATGLDTFVLPDFLVGATCQRKDGNGEYPPLKAGRYKVEEAAFFHIVLGEYAPQSAQQLISHEWIDRAVKRQKAWLDQYGERRLLDHACLQGVDAAEYGADPNMSVFRYEDIPHVSKPESWTGMDTDAGATMAAGIYNSRPGVLRACCDATGVGANYAPKMRRLECTAHSVKVASKPTKEIELGQFFQLRDELYWDLREWLRKDPNAGLPDDPKLIEELSLPTYEFDRGTRRIRVTGKDEMKKLLRRSPDRMESLLMTFYKPTPFYPAELDG